MAYFRYTVLGLFLLTAALLLAFGPRPAPHYKPGYVVVQYWEKWTGTEAAQMEQIVNDFNATVGQEKHIQVAYLSQSNIDLKTLIATSAGVPPDIAGIWDAQLAPYAAIDALIPLDEMAQEHGIRAEDYKEIYWDPCHYNGKLFGLISTPASTALHWNKRIFLEHAAALQAAGCDPTRAPRTLDELNRYAAALVDRDASGHILTLGFIPEEPGWYIVQTPLWFGGELYDPRSGKLTVNSPESVAAMNWIRGFSQRLGAAALSNFQSAAGTFDSPENPFLAGQVAMELQGPWMANHIADFKPSMDAWHHPLSWNVGKSPAERASNFEWAVAPFPSVYSDHFTKPDDFIDKGVTWCASDMLAIPRGAKHPREAFEFIAYVQRLDVMEKLCSLHCKNTPLSHHSDTWYANHPNPYVEIFDRLASSPRARTLPPIPTWSQVTEELGAVTQRVAQLKADSKPALDESQERLQTLLDQFRQRHPETTTARSGETANGRNPERDSAPFADSPIRRPADSPSLRPEAPQ